MRSHRSLFLLPLALLFSACGGEEPLAAPTRSQLIQAYVDTGLSEDIANCVVGIGEGQLEMVDLDPNTSTPAATQELVDELILSCVNASQLASGSFDVPEALAFEGQPDAFGDDPVLDDLWLLCEAGAGSSCDELWETAPVASAYEHFGVTCGERFSVLDCTVELPLDPGDLDLAELRPAEPEEQLLEE